jgi:hypothetical protein
VTRCTHLDAFTSAAVDGAEDLDDAGLPAHANGGRMRWMTEPAGWPWASALIFVTRPRSPVLAAVEAELEDGVARGRGRREAGGAQAAPQHSIVADPGTSSFTLSSFLDQSHPSAPTR